MKLVLSENPAIVEVRDRESTPRREAREQKESLAESAMANGFEPRQMPTTARDSSRARALEARSEKAARMGERARAGITAGVGNLEPRLPRKSLSTYSAHAWVLRSTCIFYKANLTAWRYKVYYYMYLQFSA